jgi:hypothetical protein
VVEAEQVLQVTALMVVEQTVVMAVLAEAEEEQVPYKELEGQESFTFFIRRYYEHNYL